MVFLTEIIEIRTNYSLMKSRKIIREVRVSTKSLEKITFKNLNKNHLLLKNLIHQ